MKTPLSIMLDMNPLEMACLTLNVHIPEIQNKKKIGLLVGLITTVITHHKQKRKVVDVVDKYFEQYVSENHIVDFSLKLAKKAHDGQLRKWTKEPEAYINHPIRVAEKVWKYITSGMPYYCNDGLRLKAYYISSSKFTVDDMQYIVSAALLHDVIEDTYIGTDVFKEEFPDEITNLVLELTDPVFEEGLARDCKFGITVKKWYGLSSFASLIKLSDRLDNLSDCQYAPRRWLDKYLVESGILACVLVDRHPGLGDELKKRIRSLAG